jgi:hypothetical protein
MSTAEHWLADVLLQFRKTKQLADGALAQVSDADLFRALDAETNPIAIVMKHMSGNMRSRWTDFLTTDGEKPDRNRDGEFEIASWDTRESIMAAWENGWRCVFEAIGALTPADLEKTVAIRDEPHTVVQAIDRQLTHYSYHVGQIVLLARHFAGERWRSLSIPRGRSRDFEVAKNGSTYLPADREADSPRNDSHS